MNIPTFDDVLAARERIGPFIHDTPVLRCAAIDEVAGTRVHLKAEHLQRTGAFKFRGATNAVQSLPDDVAPRGVAAHSSGNHSAALALAARLRGIACHIVMPRTAPRAKQEATAGYGAEIVFCDNTMGDRERVLAEVLERTGATEIHPFAHPDVVAGQGTATLDLLRAVPDIRTVVAPVSGGGLLSGAAVAARGVDASVVVRGAEPVLVDDAARSVAAGRVEPPGPGGTVADGLNATLGAASLSILLEHGVEVVTVTEAEIVAAMRLLWARAKQVVEPSGAVPLAGVLALRRAGVDLGPDVGVVLSGGNVDLDDLPFRQEGG